MHSLFHTCSETFTYWEPGTLKVLKWLTPYIQEGGAEGSELTPPIVTMDAGANVHILVEAAEASKWQKLLQDAFPEFEVLQDSQGKGPRLL
jgi:mevalonate pyrophosphate decarboxylase